MSAMLRAGESFSWWERLQRDHAKSQVLSLTRRIALYRRLARFSSRGYDIVIPIEQMLGRARERGRASQMLLESWLRSLNGGALLSQIVAGDVPAAEAMAIAAGEDSGRLDDGLEMAAYIAESTRRVHAAVLGGMLYPCVLLLLFVGMLAVVGGQLVPMLVKLYPVEFWPASAAGLYYVTWFVREYGLVLGGALLACGAWSAWSLPRWVSPLRQALDARLLPWSVYREVQGGLLLLTLSAVVNGGSPIDEAIRRMRRSASRWLAHHLDAMSRGLAEGKRPAQALDTGVFSETLMDDMLAYDHAGDLVEALRHLGKDTVELVIERLRRTFAIIGGVLMAGIGAGLLWTWGSFVLVVMAMRSSMGGGG